MSKQYKVYRETNYIRVIDTTTNELFNGTVKDVFVDKSNTQKNIYFIKLRVLVDEYCNYPMLCI